MSQPTSLRNRAFRLAGLGVSATALIGLFRLQSVWAHPEVDEIDPRVAAETVDEREDVLEPHALLALAQTPGQITAAIATIPKDVVQASIDTDEPTAAPPVGPELVAVPDLSGLGVHKAVSALNKAGLKVRVRDEYGWRLGAYEWAYHRVETQKIEAGTMVLPGSRIALKVELKPMKLAKGY